MSLFRLDVPARKLRAEKVAARLRSLEGSFDGDAVARLEEAGLGTDLAPDSLGTIGGGNHFCEVQSIAEVMVDDPVIDKNAAYLLVHSGSRSVGNGVFASVLDSVGEGLTLGSAEAQAYLAAHDAAVRWAALNRAVIAERAASALRTEATLISDSPHNLVEATGDAFLHRKGAAKADQALVPLAGSRDALSYLLKPTEADTQALASLAHGAGRRYDRRSMHGRYGQTKSDRLKLERTSFGGHVVCEDRQLLIEEAPGAYKNAAQVVADLGSANLAHPVAAFKPLVTFKRADLGRETR
ncbi:UNVERIFIED_CONTAM: hypothetical protein GTU68_056776 [Idotea baltica]|nr:hypothetical protein [Idotea baltica]